MIMNYECIFRRKNYTFDTDYSTVARAIEKCRPDDVRSILKRRAIINNCPNNRNETTLLHLAVGHGSDTIFKLLLKNGFDANARDSLHRTPLHHACRRQHPNNISLLLDNGANDELCDCWNRTPLHIAILTPNLWSASSSTIIARLLKPGVNIEAKCQLLGYTPLHYATENGNSLGVEALIECEANIDARSSYKNQTPLHIASSTTSKENVHLIEFLLEHGADIEALDVNEATPLHLACKFGLIQSVQLLIKRGANVDARNKFNNTPLMMAILRGSYQVVEEILKHQPSLDDERVLTMSLGCIEDSGESNPRILIREALRNYGFSLYNRNKLDSLYIAMKKSNYWHPDSLLHHPGLSMSQIEDNQEFLIQAIQDQRSYIVELLVRDGISLNTIADRSPLNFAVENGLCSMVETLLKNGADPNRNWSRDGSRPLHHLFASDAVEHGPKILEALLQYGADINLVNCNYSTPLAKALQCGSEMVNVLISHGADINIGTLPPCSFASPLEHNGNNGLIEHFKKLHIAGAYISRYNKYLLESDKVKQLMDARPLTEEEKGSDREEIWKAEVNRLKRHKINGVSLHKILISEDLVYLSNQDFVQKLKTVIKSKEFVEYGDLLANKLISDEKRNNDLKKASESFNFIFLVRAITSRRKNFAQENSLTRLPQELVTRIISNLNRLDIEQLDLCGQNLKNQLL